MTHYDTLQLPKNASSEQIKKQYRKLSLEHHPDRNGDQEMFKTISEAYQQLSDEKSRKAYDNSLNPKHNLFDVIFGNAEFGHPDIQMFHEFPFQMQKPPALTSSIEITLDQAYTGCCIPIELERTIEYNRARHTEVETLYIDVPCGIDNNECIVLPNKGNQINGGMGDAKIIVTVKNNSKLERRGLDLYYVHTISLKEALCGFTVEIDYLQNKSFKITNFDFVISPQYKKIIPNMGMKRDKNQGQFIISFNIVFPTLPSETLDKLKVLLP
jgi:DnaJ-class molecular chaperone